MDKLVELSNDVASTMLQLQGLIDMATTNVRSHYAVRQKMYDLTVDFRLLQDEILKCVNT